jgi:hypothetical protein
VAIFLAVLYIRATRRRSGASVEGRLFKVWIAWSLICALVAIAAVLLYVLVTAA